MAKRSKPESPEFLARRRSAIVELARKRRQKELVRAAGPMNRNAKPRLLLAGSAAPQS